MASILINRRLDLMKLIRPVIGRSDVLFTYQGEYYTPAELRAFITRADYLPHVCEWELVTKESVVARLNREVAQKQQELERLSR